MPTEREYFEELRDEVFAAGRAKGYEVVLPAANQIQLDIDRPWIWKDRRITNHLDVIQVVSAAGKKAGPVALRLLQEIAVTRWEAWKSPGGNCHVMLTLAQEFSPFERVCLQAILGSDPMRELLNFRRVSCGAEDPIALFRPGAECKG